MLKYSLNQANFALLKYSWDFDDVLIPKNFGEYRPQKFPPKPPIQKFRLKKFQFTRQPQWYRHRLDDPCKIAHHSREGSDKCEKNGFRPILAELSTSSKHQHHRCRSCPFLFSASSSEWEGLRATRANPQQIPKRHLDLHLVSPRGH